MVESLRSEVATEARSIFQSYQDTLVKDQGMNVVVSHFGVFSQDLINSLSVGVEDLMVSSGDKRHIVKRMFSILIEGLQNIRIHGDADQFNKQIGFLMIAKDNNHYKVVFGNLVKKEEEAGLKHYMEKINDMDESELKAMYIDVLSMGYISQKGGAGLGFLTMRLKSSHELEYRIDTIAQNQSYIAIEVTIDR